jgi:pyruvate dehydrogenase E2 component (dihydrolipoamide acetyltransferase)
LGVWLGTPIIKPPQVVNVGIGRVMDRAVVVNGEIQAQPTVVLAVSGDHRVLDGDALAMFVTDLVAVVEDPFLLLESARS